MVPMCMARPVPSFVVLDDGIDRTPDAIPSRPCGRSGAPARAEGGAALDRRLLESLLGQDHGLPRR
jgi:hypothetical protein